jgi:hypothetical protein
MGVQPGMACRVVMTFNMFAWTPCVGVRLSFVLRTGTCVISKLILYLPTLLCIYELLTPSSFYNSDRNFFTCHLGGPFSSKRTTGACRDLELRPHGPYTPSCLDFEYVFSCSFTKSLARKPQGQRVTYWAPVQRPAVVEGLETELNLPTHSS